MRHFQVAHCTAGWTAIVVASCAAASLALSPQAAPLALVSTEWPPFTNQPGQPRFALDLVEAALARLGVTANTTIVSAAEFRSALLGARFDGSAAVWKDPDRERVLIFSDPYLENRLVLVGRHGADVSAKAPGDLKGKSVAIVEGYSYGDAIDNSGIVMVRSTSEEDSLAKLLDSSVDYTLMDDLVVQYIVSNYPEQAGTRLEIGLRPLVTRPLFFAVKRSRPGAESMIARFNAQIRGMIADRTYHRLLHVNWIRADITGDGVPEYVPADDKAGTSEPKRVYSLFTASTTPPKLSEKTGFYVGGSLYQDWASVPNRYKVLYSTDPDPGRSSGSIFTFRW